MCVKGCRKPGRGSWGSEGVEVGGEGRGKSVGNVGGDGGVGLAEELSGGEVDRIKEVFDKGVDHFGVQDEDGGDAQWLGLKGEAE